ncbi:MAG: EthD family reductase [Anaerolineales bacterium]|nr:EthD family reductase [Anaerolineales bacterium]
MHKVVILIEPSQEWLENEKKWPTFLHLAEDMPGLRREAISYVARFLGGATPFMQMHELFFDSLAEAEQALNSPQGKAAGRTLREMTGGHMTLFLAEHKEDSLEHIRSYLNNNDQTGSA